MTAGKWVVAGVVVAAAGAIVWSERTRKGPGLGAEAEADVELSDLPSRRHICQASDIPEAISGRHPLYRRPSVPRPAATALMTSGWSSWVTRPPSEES
ncbi:MAG: hypothetical protein M0010_15295 [Actinomycetota bacterium]|jgi:hypothetical protein|nr:hypothetical protein [Actinomycetota bacterium]